MLSLSIYFFFFNDTATTEIYTLSLHDALPIYAVPRQPQHRLRQLGNRGHAPLLEQQQPRSEEHTSELQSRLHLVCRLLLEKKKKYEKRTEQDRQQTRTHNLTLSEADHQICTST